MIAQLEVTMQPGALSAEGFRGLSGEADVRAMVALAQAFPEDNLHVADLPYRLSSWALDDPANVGLWVDAGGQLLAWAVLQTPFWTIDYAYHPRADPNVHRHILSWAEHRARHALGTRSGRPSWFVMVLAGQTDRSRDLEEAGFVSQAHVAEDPWSKILLQRAADLPVADCALPAGFAIRPLAGDDEVAAYVRLHRAVFGSKNMTTAWRRRILRRAEYRPDLDLVAVAPDGRLAAFCICWLSSASGAPSGQIEPLGVHQVYRELGVGQAILSEGLRRLYRGGAKTVRVETDKDRSAALGLYRAMGFRPLQDVLVYRRDFGGEDPASRVV